MSKYIRWEWEHKVPQEEKDEFLQLREQEKITRMRASPFFRYPADYPAYQEYCHKIVDQMRKEAHDRMLQRNKKNSRKEKKTSLKQKKSEQKKSEEIIFQ